jgi:uncharacterized protein YbaA (DUF1428 family)
VIKVTETLKKIIAQRNAEVLSGEEATYQLLVNLNRQVRAELGEASLGSWTEYQLKQTKAAIERALADYETAAKGQMSAGLKTMWALGQESVYKPLNVGGIYTGFNIPSSLLRTMEEFAFVKIESYTGGMWNGIRSELSLGALGAKTPQQVSDAIGKLLPNKPLVAQGGRTIFKDAAQRAEFVTKTELGRIYSEAANRRREDAAKYVPDLKKVWRHGHPGVPRLTHLAADGVSVPQDKPFPVRDKNGYQLMRPHDPSADFSEVAGCQCWADAWAERWGPVPKAA